MVAITSAPESTSQSRRVEQEFFDSLVKDNGTFNPFAQRGWDTIASRFRESIENVEVSSLLDIGCGTGESRQLYINDVEQYTGIDLSTASIEYAKQRFPDSNWQVADACQLPFADNSFDAVAFSSVLHHIDNYSDAVAEAYRVVKPGGIIFAFDPNLLHPAMAIFRHPKSPMYLSEGVSPNERPLLPSALRDAYANAGLTNLQQRAQSNIPYRAVAPRLINACLSAYNLVDQAWEKCGLGRWFGTFVITVGQKPKQSQ